MQRFKSRPLTSITRGIPCRFFAEKRVEEIYVKKSQVEHVLLRPDTYVGSCERTKQKLWVLDELPTQPTNRTSLLDKSFFSKKDSQTTTNASSSAGIIQKECTVTPALFKIFDEILVNAVDNHRRPNTGTDRISVDIDTQSGWITILNNGKGVPVVIHKKENIYVPELVFGHLLTGSNFEDQEVKMTGGRNGFGAKLANIFSTEFVVETGDSTRKVQYKQVWKNNMSVCEPPVIKPLPSSLSDYTLIRFLPDFPRFHMTHFSEDSEKDTLALLYRRVFDLAACNPGLRVHLNGQPLGVNGFSEYVAKFYKNVEVEPEPEPETDSDSTNLVKVGDSSIDGEIEKQFVHAKTSGGWDIAVGKALEGNDLNQMSFVNSVATHRGGTHVQYVTEQLCHQILEKLRESHKGIYITPQMIKSQICVFLNANVHNPTFDSQTKETLTSRPQTFNQAGVIPESFVDQLGTETSILQDIVEFSLAKQQASIDKKFSSLKKKKLVGIPKLDDANFAGGPKSRECTLILTEGDSAKALAVAGLSVVGRDTYGVFPLKGKLLNVRDASLQQAHQNQELVHIRTILGLVPGKTYAAGSPERDELRYGKVLLMCDQDFDGTHIKGLFINMLHHYWPELLRSGDFLEQFITPLVKATKGSSTRASSERMEFYSTAEYEKWKAGLGESESNKWRTKYYKGLGTSTAEEGKEYFRNLSKNRIAFKWSGEEDDKAVEMAFSKDKTDARKEWLLQGGMFEKQQQTNTNANATSTTTQEKTAKTTTTPSALSTEQTVSNFVHKDLIQFSHADVVRSIPSVLDGLKPSQRKVLFACFKRKLSQEIKVAQLAGYVSEQTQYHHGEASLHSTIVSMAQDFVGSNNIPLLVPAGQFGTRLQGGKDAASARYIFTRLSPLARKIFPEPDDPVLSYRQEDGESIEPLHYIPIIPSVLVNGANGMGTGWSTQIPSYNPLSITNHLIKKLGGAPATTPKTKNPKIEREQENEDEQKGLIPWFKDFQGDIHVSRKTGQVVTTGLWEISDAGEQAQKRKKGAAKKKGEFSSLDTMPTRDSVLVTISELPIGRWTEDYKQLLDSLVSTRLIRSYTEHHTDRSVKFELTISRANYNTMESKIGLAKKLKLESTMSLNNMHLFDSTGKIRKYSSPEEIIDEFSDVRLSFYQKRKDHQLLSATQEANLAFHKARFLNMVISNQLEIRGVSKGRLIEILRTNGFPMMSRSGEMISGNDQQHAEDGDSSPTTGYDYLLSIPLWNLTHERHTALQAEEKIKRQTLEELQSMTPTQMWKNDLESLRDSLVKAGGY